MDAKVLAAAEEKILDAWKEENPGFIRDGILNPDAYLQAKYKILFLLKEPYGGQDWDMREYLLKDTYTDDFSNSIYNIIRWSEGLLHLEQDLRWEELEDTTSLRTRKNDILKYVAWANIKKVSGGALADDEGILASAKKNSALLHAQVVIENPEIVVCCGSSPYYIDYVAKKELHWQKTTNGTRYLIDGKRIVIDYYHPIARINKRKLYDKLIGAVREIMTMMKE